MNELQGTVLRFCGRETNKNQRRFYDRWDDKVKFAALTPPDQLRRHLEEMYFAALLALADDPEKSLRDYTLAELAELVHDMAKEKGWWDAPREWPEIACLIHSEISEAVECYRRGELAMHIVDGKPEGLVVELADVVIRCLDYCGYIQSRRNHTLTQTVSNAGCGDRQQESDSILERLHDAHSCLGRLIASDEVCVTGCMFEVFSLAKRFNLDLPAAIEAKIHYNATRPYRHGGKKA